MTIQQLSTVLLLSGLCSGLTGCFDKSPDFYALADKMCACQDVECGRAVQLEVNAAFKEVQQSKNKIKDSTPLNKIENCRRKLAKL
ncbi:MAG: hypothetical protein OEY38_13405 [Gammaproteobacteria bacterium]|nr:hypothetical protein [Gammaproteobacteria bacterium]